MEIGGATSLIEAVLSNVRALFLSHLLLRTEQRQERVKFAWKFLREINSDFRIPAGAVLCVNHPYPSAYAARLAVPTFGYADIPIQKSTASAHSFSRSEFAS